MKKLLIFTLLLGLLNGTFAQATYQPTAANLENRKWFEDSR